MSGICYAPLDSKEREIRLIILENQQLTDTTPLKCRLLHTSLNHYQPRNPSLITRHLKLLGSSLTAKLPSNTVWKTPFCALSYVWGDPDPICEIEVDGKTAKITQSLDEALRTIQNHTKFRVIWADAICINQRNDEEKSWQVSAMPDIYSLANSVISWLGPEPIHEHSVGIGVTMKAIQHFGTQLIRCGWNLRSARDGKLVISSLNEAAESLCWQEGPHWKNLEFLSSRKYWTRFWVFQELACAQKKLFLCGSSLTKLVDSTLAFLGWWRGFRSVLGPPFLLNNLGFMMDQCHCMVRSVQLFSFDSASGQHPILYELLTNLGSLDLTDRRDIIFATIPLASDKQELGIYPDYSKTLDAVLNETACALLRQNNISTITHASEFSESAKDSSTWIPQWNAENTPPTFDLSLYAAAKGISQRLSTLAAIPLRGPVVSLDSYFVGTIEKCIRSCPQQLIGAITNLESFSRWLLEVHTIWCSGKSTTTQIDRVTPISADVKGRLLSGDMVSTPTTSRLKAEVFSDSQIMNVASLYNEVEFVDSLANLLKELKMTAVLNLGGTKELKKSEEISAYVDRLLFVIGRGCKQFSTTSGRLGLSSSGNAEPGDIIVIFPGVSVPCILRKAKPSEDTGFQHQGTLYKRIGQAYVYGIMDGEFFQKKCNLEPELLTLC